MGKRRYTKDQYIAAYNEHGSYRKAAKVLGVAKTTIHKAVQSQTINNGVPLPGMRRLFFDIETSPNLGFFWRPGYKIRLTHDNIVKERAIICICWKWEGIDEVHSLTWDENQCDKAMLEEFVKVAEKADQVIGHNGDRFDIKWFRTRCLFHRIQTRAKFDTIDTLKIARGQFNFNSNRLDYIGQFLGLGGKIETGYNLWKDIVLKNCPDAMHKMVTYCKRDVELLEKVHDEFKRYYEPKMHRAVATGGEKYDCPECGSPHSDYHGQRVTKAGTVKHRMRCKSCQITWSISNRTYLDYLREKIKNESGV